MADVIAMELMGRSCDDIYVLSPITVEKFDQGNVLARVRNLLATVASRHPLRVLADEARYDPAGGVFFAGSARKLKGTERRVAVVIGAEIPYDRYGIDTAEFRKALYVAISRAMDELIIVVDAGQRIAPNTPLAALIAHAQTDYKFRAMPRPERRLLDYARVYDDFRNANIIRPVFNEVPAPQLLHATMKDNEDFAGVYVEALLALRLGFDVSAWAALVEPGRRRALGAKEARGRRTFLDAEADGRYSLCFLPGACPALPADLQGLWDGDGCPLHPCRRDTAEGVVASELLRRQAYALAVLLFTARVGTWWVASRAVLDAFLAPAMVAELDTVLERLPAELGLDGLRPLTWGGPTAYAAPCDRSQRAAVHLVGATDLVFALPNELGGREKALVVEVKFAHHKEAHARQVATYAAMSRTPAHALLVNLLEGRAFEVQPVDLAEAARYARVLLAIRNGRASGVGGARRVNVPDVHGAVFVALDVETDGYPPAAPLLEVGAAAWYAGTESIEGTFAQVVEGARVEKDSMCGLVLPSRNNPRYGGDTRYQDELREAAAAWIAALPGRKIGLAWGSCDDFAAAGSKNEIERAIDLRTVFVRWLELNGCARRGDTTLSAAVEHLFGPDFPFAAHRAFDDVIATVAVANAIINFGGAL